MYERVDLEASIAQARPYELLVFPRVDPVDVFRVEGFRIDLSGLCHSRPEGVLREDSKVEEVGERSRDCRFFGSV